MLLLIRHAQSLANIGACDDCDCDLSPFGVEQARATGQILRAGRDLTGFRGIVSPYLRTRRTAQAIADATGLEFGTDPACREWGRTCSVGGARYEEEKLPDVVDRLARFLASLEAKRDYLIVSHAAPVFIMLQLARGASAAEAHAACVDDFWNRVENCAIHCI